MTASPNDLPRTRDAFDRGAAEGLHIGAQIYVSLRGETKADLALGESRAGVPMTPDTLVPWMSCTKPVVAVAAAQLWERGLLDLDDPVGRHVPEFGAKGKESVTVRHLLTHTAGFRAVLGDWETGGWERAVAAVCGAKLEPGWVPGRKAGYHLGTSWYVLGELVRRLDPGRRPLDQYLRDEIFLPLGMNDSWVGMPPERYREYGDRIGPAHDTSGAQPVANSRWDTEEGAAAVRPGAGGRGPARELGRFYEMLLNRGAAAGSAAARILSPQTVEAMTAAHRVGMYDHTFRHVMDWGLGFIVNSARYGADTVPYGFGPYASARTFGHGGSQSAASFADAEHGLAVVVVLNGMPGESRHHKRMGPLLGAIYEDLGLTEGPPPTGPPTPPAPEAR